MSLLGGVVTNAAGSLGRLAESLERTERVAGRHRDFYPLLMATLDGLMVMLDIADFAAVAAFPLGRGPAGLGTHRSPRCT